MSGVVGVAAQCCEELQCTRATALGQHLQVRQSRHGAQTGKTSHSNTQTGLETERHLNDVYHFMIMWRESNYTGGGGR